jgi:hypothetical protein
VCVGFTATKARGPAVAVSHAYTILLLTCRQNLNILYHLSRFSSNRGMYDKYTTVLINLIRGQLSELHRPKLLSAQSPDTYHIILAQSSLLPSQVISPFNHECKKAARRQQMNVRVCTYANRRTANDWLRESEAPLPRSYSHSFNSASFPVTANGPCPVAYR